MRHAPYASLFLALAAACAPAANTGAADVAAVTAELESAKARIAELETDRALATAPPADATPAVYFVNLQDGDEVTSPFRVIFGVHGKGVAPALVDKENTGHHHLLINTELSAEEMEYAIPNDDQHLHFGGGQTETVLALPPGRHTLQLVFGDLNHELHEPAMMSQKITVTVK
jgi:hypothetical protein